MTKSRNLITPKFQWESWQIAIVVCCYHSTSNAALSKVTGATVNQLYGLAKRYRLNKSKWFYAHHPSNGTTKSRPSIGAGSRFQKGIVPWNTGRRGYSAPGCEKGWFKQGQSPHNTHAIGSYRYDKDGTLQRKISNAKGSNSKRWRSVHELVWIQHNGPVPEKHICVFKPGTRTNVLEEITIDKVECISLADHCLRNSVHRYGPEIFKAHQLIGQITRQINRKEKQNGNSN